MTAIAQPAPVRIAPARLLLAMRRDPLGTLAGLAREHGDLAHLRAAGRHIVLLSHPDLAHELLAARHRSLAKGPALRRARRVLGDGLLTAEGEPHLSRRRALQPAFHRERVAGYAQTMAACAERAAASWSPGRLDVAAAMSHLTLEIAGATLFDADVTADAEGVGRALSDLMGLFGLLTLPFGEQLLRLPIPAAGRLRRAERRLDAVIERVVRAAEADDAAAHPAAGASVLQMLLAARDEQGRPLDARQVRDEAVTLFLAGHETTATALTWAWDLLGRHPQAEARLHAEVDALGPGALGAADLPQLGYARAVLAEAMRLYPPAWVIGRAALEDVEVGGYRIPAGATVLVSPWVMHRDARFFPEPLRFEPARWIGEGEPRRPGYMPFGAGPRMCIGERFAWMEGTLLLAVIARRWRLRPASARPATPQPSVTLRVRGGLPMLAAPRPLSGNAAEIG